MQTSHINDVTQLDLLAELNNGDIAMEILITGPLDDEPEVLSTLETKIRNYIREAMSDEFRAQFELQDLGRLMIRIVTQFAVAPGVLRAIESLQEEAKVLGIRLSLLRKPGVDR